MISSLSGHIKWRLYVNGTQVAVYTATNTTAMTSTGNYTLSSPVTGLTGAVFIQLGLTGAAGDTTSFTLDNFVLNGFVQRIPTAANIGQGESNAQRYRYGFNGQERDIEIGDDSYGALYWEYDSRIGRRWNLDPKENPFMSPYSTYANNPTLYSDALGDSAIVGRDGNGNPTGQLGQRFAFVNDGTVGDGSSTDAVFVQLQRSFLNNLNQQINRGGHSFNGRPVSLNLNDPSASVITVTFSSVNQTQTNAAANQMTINQFDQQSRPNTATHEWLHSAGLMDRNIDVFTYTQNNGIISVGASRSDNIDMKILPPNYDPQYNWQQNAMSRVVGNQITQQQWNVIFSGFSEESLGRLGRVSILLPATGPFSFSSSSFRNRVYNAAYNMYFTSNQAFKPSPRGANGFVPYNQSSTNPWQTQWIIHRAKRNIFPNVGNINNLHQSNPTNKVTLDRYGQ